MLEKETFTKAVLEPACGGGHISEVLQKHGYNVSSFDLIDRGYGKVQDFFNIKHSDMDIVTNPPYKIALPFLKHALDIIPNGNKVALFLRVLFLEENMIFIMKTH